MSISGISAVSGYSGIRGFYPIYSAGAVQGVRAAQSVKPGTDGTAKATIDGAKDAEKNKKVKQKDYVSNAVAKGNEDNKELVSVSVTPKISVSPKYGGTYTAERETGSTVRTTSGNNTNTNPYEKLQANLDYLMASGANLDLTA